MLKEFSSSFSFVCRNKGVSTADINRNNIRGERAAKRKWMTEEIVQLIDIGRGDKKNQDVYEKIHIEVVQKCMTAREAWLNSNCK